MQKWEYKFIKASWSEFPNLKTDVAELDRLGQEGWEATSVKGTGDGYTFVILLKRSIPDALNRDLTPIRPTTVKRKNDGSQIQSKTNP